MKKYINECVGCPPERGCLGTSCPKRRRIVYICDRCGAEIDESRRGRVFEFCSACEAYKSAVRIYDSVHSLGHGPDNRPDKSPEYSLKYNSEQNACVKRRIERGVFRQC